MSGTIKVNFDGDPSGLLAGMQKIEDKVEKQKVVLDEYAAESAKAFGALAKHLGISVDEMDKLDKSAKKSKQSITDHGGVVDQLVGSTLKWAAATLSVATAMSAVNEAQRRQKEVANASLDAATREASSREELARNLNFDQAEIARADKRITDIQQEFGIGDKGFVTKAYAAAQAEAPDDAAGADALTRSAAKFSGRNPSDMQPMVEGFGTLRRVFGDKSQAELEGFMGNIMKFSPITDAANEARRVLPLAEILQENVDLGKISKEQAAAEHIAYQHQMMRLMGDKSGETSAEQMVRLTGRLDQIFGEDEELRKVDAGGTRGRLELLQHKDRQGLLSEWAKETQGKLMEKGLGEAKARQAVESLLTGKFDEGIDKEIANLKFDPAVGNAADAFRKGDPIMVAAAESGRAEFRKHQEDLARVSVQGQKALADQEYKRMRDAYTAEHPIAGDAVEMLDDWTLGWSAGSTPVGQMRNMQRKINSTLEGERNARKMWGPDKERDALIKTAEDVLKKIGGYIETAEKATKEAMAATREARAATLEAQRAGVDAARKGDANRREFKP